ncbi:MAG: helix-turn-helix domain-containing protein [Nitrospirae bacterium]|nr:helix-turn-helix domain-containing protein [Nitrospirota bacterium]
MRDYRIGSVMEAGKLLKILAEKKEPAGVRVLAGEIGTSENKAFRLLQTLEDIGFVRRIGEGYELGTGMALFWARAKARAEMKIEEGRKELDLLGGRG